jgi:hypothetical protein
VLPPPAWRLIGPIEAAVGVLMLGISTSVIVAAVHQLHSVQLELAKSGESRQKPDSE